MTWCAHGGISKTILVAYLHMMNETFRAVVGLKILRCQYYMVGIICSPWLR